VVRERELLRYCDNGIIKIENSAAEQALRSVAIGARNYLLAGADSCRTHVTTIYSLIGTAKVNGRPRGLLASGADADRRPSDNCVDELVP
jgi:hypothetical protein